MNKTVKIVLAAAVAVIILAVGAMAMFSNSARGPAPGQVHAQSGWRGM